jgi:hypothetical protein
MKISNKKRDILIIIAALTTILLIIIGFFYFQPKEKNSPTENKEGPEDFSITGNIIENKKEGLNVVIPDGWKAEVPEQISEEVWGANIFSPDADIVRYAPPDSYLINKGCMISVNIEKSPTFFDAISNYLANITKDTKISSFNDETTGVMMVGGSLAWKEISFKRENVGERLELRIPLENSKLLYFVFISSDLEKTYCLDEFNKFLEKTSINK